MSLFDIIFDFFANNVFIDVDGRDVITNIWYPIGLQTDNGELTFYMSLRDWLCYTATFISISILVVFCCLFIYKIIKTIGGLLK